jgi:S1-C subfamily serine protease
MNPKQNLCAAALALCLGGCAQSFGDAAPGFLNPGVAAAYLPLSGTSNIVFTGYGAGVVIGRGVAVTNAHNANLVDSDSILGTSLQYDLLYFHTETGTPLVAGEPVVGEEVIAYGEGGDGSLRMVRGQVAALNAPVLPRCPACGTQSAFTFAADAGPGFSGGPVVDAVDGKLVGIVFGFVDQPNGSRLMYAYDMDRVSEEFARAQGRAVSP